MTPHLSSVVGKGFTSSEAFQVWCCGCGSGWYWVLPVAGDSGLGTQNLGIPKRPFITQIPAPGRARKKSSNPTAKSMITRKQGRAAPFLPQRRSHEAGGPFWWAEKHRGLKWGRTARGPAGSARPRPRLRRALAQASPPPSRTLSRYLRRRLSSGFLRPSSRRSASSASARSATSS